jgi:hypothetical protein
VGTLGTPHRWCPFVWYRVSLPSCVVKAYAAQPGGRGYYPILYSKTRRNAAHVFTIKTGRNAAQIYAFAIFVYETKLIDLKNK